ncbi:hypothetical protein DBV05_g147 [Lasiodiplodia theobromae]|uniref:Uncharacterized protein n=1 Tax=Lasiodiplodia theobromae TaxID=45133 RepID=A0A5N5DSY3_9PEZI|nr:hypothetical protein DBV05_g147 [Lasiodiplodia theobromae]
MALVHPRVAAITTTIVPSSPTASPNAAKSAQTAQKTWENTRGIPKSTIALAVGIGAPFLLIAMGSIMIWGYIIGRREKSGREFKFQRRKTEQSSQQGNGRATLELEGREVQEMDGCVAAEVSGEPPPVEMPQEREPAELPLTVGTVPPTSAWVMMKPETMRF